MNPALSVLRRDVTAQGDRAAKPARQFRIGANLSCGPPFVDELSERREVVQSGRGHDGPGELIDESGLVGLRQKRSPRERIEQRVP